MRRVDTDVDIDVFGREHIVAGLECVAARIDRDGGKSEKHSTGVYFQNIPRDPTTNMATLDHKVAKDFGYFKIDILNVNMYEGVRDETHLLALMDADPPWDFFEYQEITDQLFHLNGYSHLLQKYKPRSVEDIAMVLAIIRPGKAHLQSANWDRIKKEVWIKSTQEGVYDFKRQHAIAYALAIIVNLNLLLEKMSKE